MAGTNGDARRVLDACRYVPSRFSTFSPVHVSLGGFVLPLVIDIVSGEEETDVVVEQWKSLSTHSHPAQSIRNR